jgi:hypothetical protein
MLALNRLMLLLKCGQSSRHSERHPCCRTHRVHTVYEAVMIGGDKKPITNDPCAVIARVSYLSVTKHRPHCPLTQASTTVRVRTWMHFATLNIQITVNGHLIQEMPILVKRHGTCHLNCPTPLKSTKSDMVVGWRWRR